MEGRPWEAGDVAALVANPIYALEIHPSYARPHAHLLSESQWVLSNCVAAEESGIGRWLLALLSALKLDHEEPEVQSGPLLVADPYPAITVSRGLCIKHPPLVDEETWLGANAIGMEEDSEVWLRNLLSVLKGAYA